MSRTGQSPFSSTFTAIATSIVVLAPLALPSQAQVSGSTLQRRGEHPLDSRGQVMTLDEALKLERNKQLRQQFPDQQQSAPPPQPEAQPEPQPQAETSPTPIPRDEVITSRPLPQSDGNISISPGTEDAGQTPEIRNIEIGRPLETVIDGAQQDGAQQQAPDATSQPTQQPASSAASGSGNSNDKVTLAEIDAVAYDDGPLPKGRSALTVKVQVLLDRANTSPGIVDGFNGGMSTSAIKEFERLHGFRQDGIMDRQVWDALGGDSAAPVMTRYTITPEDMSGIVPKLPKDYAELAKLDHMGYERVTEGLAEKFHMAESFLVMMNPGKNFTTGEDITVIDAGARAKGKVDRIAIDKRTQRLKAYDGAGNILSDYPVTIGSTSTPSPSGSYEVTAVAVGPNYTYNPKNFKQGENDKILILPPGPNGPVGSIWIDLSRPTYGIHGTPRPDLLFTTQSHGCVRMTNWDAEELAKMVHKGTFVEFVE